MGRSVHRVSALLSLWLFSCLPLAAQQRSLAQPPIWADKPSLTDIEKKEDAKLAAADSAIAALLKARGVRTIENTVELFDKAAMELDDAVGLAKLVRQLHPDSALRDKAMEYVSKADSARKALALNRGVYDALAAVDLSNADPATRYYVGRRLQLFRLAGVNRSDAERAKLKALLGQLSGIESTFNHNIDEDHRTLSVKPSELEGLPQDFLDSHKPDQDGMIRLTNDYSDFFPVMKFAIHDGVRRRMYQTIYSTGYPKNRDLAIQMLRLRSEIAQLLGYSSWADYSAASKMTKNAKTIENFIAELDKAQRPVADREFPVLLEEKRKFNPAATDISEHEFLFLAEQVRRQKYGVDSVALRAYLPVPAVKQGLLDVSSKFFQVEFRKEADSVAWHPSVETWDVLDHGSMIGRIYLDLYPRPGKTNGGETLSLRAGKVGQQLPEAVLIATLPNPSTENPGLMEQEELDTFFHEFGHAVHKILFGARARWAGANAGLSGTLEFDFVEVPSQFFEKFPELPSILPTFAHHYKTNEPIPVDLVNRLRRATAVGRGINSASYNALSALSLELHQRNPSDLDLDAVYADENHRYSLLKMVPDTYFWASWPHLADYSSNFYTYDWDAVIVEDFFAQIDPEKPLAAGAASRYRKTVLEPGGSVSANDLVRNFLGRPQNLEAYRAWLEEEFRVNSDGSGTAR